MAKTIVKELIIVLLLCLAIILLLGILLYEYVPMAKTIPNPVSYTTPEEVKQELAESGVNKEQVIMTYEVDSTDLNNYKKIQDYKPGKTNPFSSYEPAQTTGTNGTNTTTGSSQTGGSGNNTANSGTSNATSSQANTTTQNTTTSGGQFFQDKGTK